MHSLQNWRESKMADMKKIATRDSYGAALAALGAEHTDLVVLDADLAGATKTGVFKKAFPDRHFDFGIAEGNMMAAAAGMAAAGLVPLPPALPCLPPDGPLSRCVTPSAIPT